MSAAPSIIRRKLLDFERAYTTIPNTWLRDARLSYKARGLLGALLSHADGFEISIASLAEGSDKEGREAIMSGLAELRGHGYLRLDKSRDARGKYRTEYVLTEPTQPLALAVDNSAPARSANPTRTQTRSANPTATRSANPTSIEKTNREIRATRVSQTEAPVDNAQPLCPSTDQPHRFNRSLGYCADCYVPPTERTA